ncbi:hypothetical protein TNCV_3516071 [Trichonephila clavipes]|nr:hypothetical protein TNCV_3516071 [Trichonephila clavipes]
MTPFEILFSTKMKSCQDIEIVELLNDEITAQFQEQRDDLRQELKDAIHQELPCVHADILHSDVAGFVIRLGCVILCGGGYVEHMLL